MILGELKETHQEYKRNANFLTLLTIIAGDYKFLNDIGIQIKYSRTKNNIYSNYKGIIFVGRENEGHFHFIDNKKDGILCDSYNKTWQLDKTNGFCQTFAIMGFLGLTAELAPYKYMENIQICLNFLKTKRKYIQKHWKRIVNMYRDTLWFDDINLSSTEICKDIDRILLPENEMFIQRWMTNEYVYS
jgi:hypothetical protein